MIYTITQLFFYWSFKIIWRMKIVGLSQIPKSGAYIVAANHRSLADPPLVGCVLPVKINFLAKRELFKFYPFAWYIRHLNAHPISRAGGAEAIKVAVSILKKGGQIIMFPEGTRQKTDELGEPRAGVGRLAMMAQVPVVPTYVHNSGHLFKLKKPVVRFGNPVFPGDFKKDKDMAQAVMSEIKRLKTAILQGKN